MNIKNINNDDLLEIEENNYIYTLSLYTRYNKTFPRINVYKFNNYLFCLTSAKHCFNNLIDNNTFSESIKLAEFATGNEIPKEIIKEYESLFLIAKLNDFKPETFVY